MEKKRKEKDGQDFESQGLIPQAYIPEISDLCAFVVTISLAQRLRTMIVPTDCVRMDASDLTKWKRWDKS